MSPFVARAHEGEPRPGGCGDPEAGSGARFSSPFYHWKKPDAKERHGLAMGIVQVDEKGDAAVIGALKKAYPQLEGFVVVIDKLEWR